MKAVKDYLDSTYLKTPQQSGLSPEETHKAVMDLVREAMQYHFYAVMIRPKYVKEVKDYLTQQNSSVKVGTVIGFHEGTYSTAEKLAEAKQAIQDGADDLDFVTNYVAYKNGEIDKVKSEILEATRLGLEAGKTVKWILEIAALSDEQIASFTKNISQWVEEAFPGREEYVFVKSSTGFYKTEGGKPNGATVEGIKIMLENCGKLPVKPAGGIRTHEDAVKMIEMGVKRIGTSSAKALSGESNHQASDSDY